MLEGPLGSESTSWLSTLVRVRIIPPKGTLTFLGSYLGLLLIESVI